MGLHSEGHGLCSLCPACSRVGGELPYSILRGASSMAVPCGVIFLWDWALELSILTRVDGPRASPKSCATLTVSA